MTNLLYALGGVVAGALASGGVQSYLARADRRRDARGAARLLFMKLHNARFAVQELRERRDWDQMITDWDAYGVAWDRYNESLARTVRTMRFHTVSSAFECLASLAASRARSETLHQKSGAAPNFTVLDKHLREYVINIDAAKEITLRASFRWWEFRARKQALAG